MSLVLPIVTWDMAWLQTPWTADDNGSLLVKLLNCHNFANDHVTNFTHPPVQLESRQGRSTFRLPTATRSYQLGTAPNITTKVNEWELTYEEHLPISISAVVHASTSQKIHWHFMSASTSLKLRSFVDKLVSFLYRPTTGTLESIHLALPNRYLHFARLVGPWRFSICVTISIAGGIFMMDHM